MLSVRIITPSQLLFEGQAESVTLPGSVGSFTVLNGHAPIISSLCKGKVVCKNAEGIQEFEANGGFAEVKDNVVSICIE
ncbi:MAG: F0F1 ATP synthase subunit epsilon [Bacteroidaceae bacterium]|nr:F0F1 ATP synthase subunit epsilon [Bacteroidaceae bacterium]